MHACQTYSLKKEPKWDFTEYHESRRKVDSRYREAKQIGLSYTEMVARLGGKAALDEGAALLHWEALGSLL